MQRPAMAAAADSGGDGAGGGGLVSHKCTGGVLAQLGGNQVCDVAVAADGGSVAVAASALDGSTWDGFAALFRLKGECERATSCDLSDSLECGEQRGGVGVCGRVVWRA